MSAKRTESVAPGSQRSRGFLMKIGWLACMAAVMGLPPGAVAQEVPQSRPVERRPQARTQQERDDFNRAYALTGGSAAESAADNFASRYPGSELRRYLYSSAMLQYQRENNSAKMLAM